MKFTTATLILWGLPIMAINAANEGIPFVSVDDSLPMMTMAEPPTVLWDECNMKPDRLGVLSCYRMLSDLSEQHYYYKDDQEYPDYPVRKD